MYTYWYPYVLRSTSMYTTCGFYDVSHCEKLKARAIEHRGRRPPIGIKVEEHRAGRCTREPPKITLMGRRRPAVRTGHIIFGQAKLEGRAVRAPTMIMPIEVSVEKFCRVIEMTVGKRLTRKRQQLFGNRDRTE